MSYLSLLPVQLLDEVAVLLLPSSYRLPQELLPEDLFYRHQKRLRKYSINRQLLIEQQRDALLFLAGRRVHPPWRFKGRRVSEYLRDHK